MVILAAGANPASTPIALQPFQELRVKVTMPDGVRLSTNVFHPGGTGPFSVNPDPNAVWQRHVPGP